MTHDTGLAELVDDGKGGRAPDPDHTYSVDDREFELFVDVVDRRANQL